MAEEVAVLAGGCFWCTEAVFNDVVGVKSVESGYIGGDDTRAQGLDTLAGLVRFTAGGDVLAERRLRVDGDDALVGKVDDDVGAPLANLAVHLEPHVGDRRRPRRVPRVARVDVHHGRAERSDQRERAADPSSRLHALARGRRLNPRRWQYRKS